MDNIDKAIIDALPSRRLDADDAGAIRASLTASGFVIVPTVEHNARNKAVAALDDVVTERMRQISVEGWTPEHDDEHHDGEMALAAACYAAGDKLPLRDYFPPFTERALWLIPEIWPWHPDWWNPKDRRRDLVRAGALILAEIERLDRAALKDASHE